MKWVKRFIGALLLITVPPVLVPVHMVSAEEPQWEAVDVQKRTYKRRELNEPKFDGAYVVLDTGKYVYLDRIEENCKRLPNKDFECLLPADSTAVVSLKEIKGFYAKPPAKSNLRTASVNCFIHTGAVLAERNGKDWFLFIVPNPDKHESILILRPDGLLCGTDSAGVYCELKDPEATAEKARSIMGDRPAVFWCYFHALPGGFTGQKRLFIVEP